MARLIRTEILKIRDSKHAYPNWSIETLGDDRGNYLIVLSRLSDDWRPGDDVFASFDLDFQEARTVAIAILRAVYYEMPRTWYLAEGDPEEYLAHLLEILYESVPRRDANPRDGIKNLLALVRAYKRALVQIGKARKRENYWKRRYENAARWARLNHRRLEQQRKQLRSLNQKVIRLTHAATKRKLPSQHQPDDSASSGPAGHGDQKGA